MIGSYRAHTRLLRSPRSPSPSPRAEVEPAPSQPRASPEPPPSHPRATPEPPADPCRGTPAHPNTTFARAHPRRWRLSLKSIAVGGGRRFAPRMPPTQLHNHLRARRPSCPLDLWRWLRATWDLIYLNAAATLMRPTNVASIPPPAPVAAPAHVTLPMTRKAKPRLRRGLQMSAYSSPSSLVRTFSSAAA
jgi:hypothetical protein